MSAMREELHQLVDQLREDELRPALELIRDRVAEHGGQGRDLPFFASFEVEPDLAERAEEILSAELGRCFYPGCPELLRILPSAAPSGSLLTSAVSNSRSSVETMKQQRSQGVILLASGVKTMAGTQPARPRRSKAAVTMAAGRADRTAFPLRRC